MGSSLESMSPAQLEAFEAEQQQQVDIGIFEQQRLQADWLVARSRFHQHEDIGPSEAGVTPAIF